MPKYSIIVPVYNMQELLPKCVDSIKAQTYSDFEVVLVDDCSTDESYKMCCEIAATDKRFKVVRQDKNGGSSVARNTGLGEIQGEYVIFIDSDDYIEEGLLEEIEKKAIPDKYDWVTWGMYYDIKYPDGLIKIEKSSLNAKEDKDVAMPKYEDWRLLCLDTFFASPCNKLYRADIIKNNSITFDPRCVDFEDLIFNLQYAEYVKSFAILKKPFYHYRQLYGQIAPLKRRWAKVKRFEVSDKVYMACKKFIEISDRRNIHLCDIMRYSYKAYMNEIEYEYRRGDKGTFKAEIGKLVSNRCFRAMLKAMKQPELQKLVLPMKILILAKQKYLFSELLWAIKKKELG